MNLLLVPPPGRPTRARPRPRYRLRSRDDGYPLDASPAGIARPAAPGRGAPGRADADDERHRGAPEDPGDRPGATGHHHHRPGDAERDREGERAGGDGSDREVVRSQKLQRVTGAGDEPSASVELGWQVQPASSVPLSLHHHM